jgi:hypothetical protein
LSLIKEETEMTTGYRIADIEGFSASSTQRPLNPANPTLVLVHG